jgi:hypothetical protein
MSVDEALDYALVLSELTNRCEECGGHYLPSELHLCPIGRD